MATTMRKLGGTLLITTVAAVAAAGTLVMRTPSPAPADGAYPDALIPQEAPAASGAHILHRSPERSIALSPTSARQLEAFFARTHYGWEHTPVAVPRVRVLSFPEDMAAIRDAQERKQLFVQSVLPIVLMENEKIGQDRAHLLALFARHDMGLSVRANETRWLERLVNRYRLAGSAFDPAVRAQLLRRVNTVPPSLALAMSAHESGWGTSRFCQNGNNLFGEWTYQQGTGIVPKARPSGASHEVAIFDSIADSIRSYMYNLNTHRAYAGFRAAREHLAEPAASGASIRLAAEMTLYSERGKAYAHDIIGMIRDNDLTRFDVAHLAAQPPMVTAQSTTPNQARQS